MQPAQQRIVSSSSVIDVQTPQENLPTTATGVTRPAFQGLNLSNRSRFSEAATLAPSPPKEGPPTSNVRNESGSMELLLGLLPSNAPVDGRLALFSGAQAAPQLPLQKGWAEPESLESARVQSPRVFFPSGLSDSPGPWRAKKTDSLKTPNQSFAVHSSTGFN